MSKSVRLSTILLAGVVWLSSPQASLAQWQNVGGPGGCSVGALAVSGGCLLAGTPFGIFVSEDDGGTWASAGATGSATSGDAATRGIYAFGADIFASTRSGLFRSTDNGATWTAVNSGLPEHPWVECLADAAGVLCCGLKDGKIFRSTDRGAHWVISGVGLPQEDFMALSSLTVLGPVVYAAGSFGIYHSEDSGASWAPMVPALPNEWWVDPLITDGRRLIAATGGGLFEIEDGGKAWSKLGEGWYPDQPFTFLASSGQAILAGLEEGGIFLSMDAGKSWASIAVGPARDDTVISGFAAIGPRLFIAVYEDGLFRSDDLGATWTRLEGGFPSAADITCIAGMDGDLFAAVDEWGGPGHLCVKAAGSAGWERLGLVLAENQDLTCLEAAGGNLIAGTDAGLFVSDDRGRTWSPAGPEGDEAPRVNSMESIGTRVFACTGDGILLSTDRGRTWRQVFPRPPEVRNIERLVPFGDYLLAGGDHGIIVSKDLGETWAPAGLGPPGSRHCSSIATDGKVLVAGIYPRPRESGKADEDEIVAPLEMAFDIAVSEDGGRSWRVVTAGLPDAFRVGYLLTVPSGFVTSLESTYTKGGKKSIGLFLSTNGGVTWTSDWPGAWAAAAINDFLIDKDEILAATGGAGIWRLPLSALKKKAP